MPYIECTDKIEINAPVNTVFDVVSDYPNWKQWIPIYKCHLLNSNEVREGVKVRHQYGYRPIIISDFVRQIEKIEQNRKIKESYISGGLLGVGIWTFKQEGKATTASYYCKVKSNNLLNHILFSLMGYRAHRNVYEPLLKKLKVYCEGQKS